MIALNLRAVVNQLHRSSFFLAQQARFLSNRQPSDAPQPTPETNDEFDIEAFLAKSTWSVSSLLPEHDVAVADAADTSTTPITPAKLRHLLRLSALPEPETSAKEAKILKDLACQLHFVRQMQQVDVTGVEPLQAIRDETRAGELEAEITIDKVKETLENEEVLGKYYQRLRRRKDVQVEDLDTPKSWQPLKHAARTVDQYFVVDRSEEKKG